jgi:ABC-type multidrug transport system fused ATPase/permease subunit
LFISHRVSALEWVDRIVVLDQGIVKEQGTHEQLIRKAGLYKALHGRPEVSAVIGERSTQPLHA